MRRRQSSADDYEFNTSPDSSFCFFNSESFISLNSLIFLSPAPGSKHETKAKVSRGFSTQEEKASPGQQILSKLLMMLMMSINFQCKREKREKSRKPEIRQRIFRQSALINVWRMSGIDAVVLFGLKKAFETIRE
jgi:hypothetical protein